MNTLTKIFGEIGDFVLGLFKESRPADEQDFAQEHRAFYLTVACVEVMAIGLAFGLIIDVAFGGGINAYCIGMLLWIALLGFTPMSNRFFAFIPKNSGAVIMNTLLSYERSSDANATKLEPTKALREVGPGLQGLLFWEKVGWVIDLGKQIVLEPPIIAYSKDNIELTVKWQVILTPLRQYLVNLVRHEGETVKKFFEGRCRSKIIEIVSKEFAQGVPAHDGQPAIPSIFEKMEYSEDADNSIKREFNGLFGGGGEIHLMEKQFGTFTNDPQLIEVVRSTEFQKSVESLQINENNARAMGVLKERGLNPKQALIAVLASQDKPTRNLIDLSADVRGLENLRNLSFVGAGPFGEEDKPKKGGK